MSADGTGGQAAGAGEQAAAPGGRTAGTGGCPDGIVVVDKPGGMTSHDVVGRIRRLARTRRVGHGGTLDPMATGVLVIGVGRATRLLTYVIGAGKSYTATIRLGQSTTTDDAEGEVVATVPAGHLTDEQIRAGLARLTGEIEQVPSSVSAVKIDGRRAYQRVRDGEAVALAARRVTVARLEVLAIRRGAGIGAAHDTEEPTGVPGPGRPDAGEVVDVDVVVDCSSGTYVRALARDLGAGLGVGGHLVALRRTAVGGITLDEAVTLPELERRAPAVVELPLAAAARRFLPAREVDAARARVLSHGGPLDPVGVAGPYAVFEPGGALVAVVRERDGRARPEIVLAPAGAG